MFAGTSFASSLLTIEYYELLWCHYCILASIVCMIWTYMYMYTLLGAGNWVQPSRDQQINVQNWQFYSWNLEIGGIFYLDLVIVFAQKRGGRMAQKSVILGTLEKWSMIMVTNICIEWRGRARTIHPMTDDDDHWYNGDVVWHFDVTWGRE